MTLYQELLYFSALYIFTGPLSLEMRLLFIELSLIFPNQLFWFYYGLRIDETADS